MAQNLSPVAGTPASHAGAHFSDIRDNEGWLAEASRGGPREACAAFLALLEKLQQEAPSAARALSIMESLHPRVLAAIDQHARKFSGKPLPLAHAEALALAEVCELCLAMARSYRRLLRSGIKHPAELAAAPVRSGLALTALRSLEYAALHVCSCHQARREVAPESWRVLHHLYAQAEQLGVAQTAIGPVDEAGEGQTCTAVYARPLLQALAHPYGLLGRESRWLSAWLRKWGGRIAVVPWLQKPGAFCVHLDEGHAPAWESMSAAEQSNRRYLDISRLRHSLRKRLHLLEAGHSPAAVGLGEDCTQPGTSRLLKSLLADWSDGAPLQRPRRRAAPADCATAEAAIGIPAAHLAMSGVPFESEVKVWDYSAPDSRIGHSGPAWAPVVQAPRAAKATEGWRIVDESALGFRLHRAAPVPGVRIAHQQLLAVRPHGARGYILAEVRWLMQGADGAMHIGTQALPGLAEPCAVRPESADPSHPEPFFQAFLLSGPRGLPSSLVLPAGCFAAWRRLEVRIGSGVVRASLEAVVQRGFDYERAALGTA